MPASFNAPVSGGLDDLFDLGGGVSMPMGAYSPPKTVSFDSLEWYILLNNVGDGGIPKNKRTDLTPV